MVEFGVVENNHSLLSTISPLAYNMIESSGGCLSDVETLVALWKLGDNFNRLKPSRREMRSWTAVFFDQIIRIKIIHQHQKSHFCLITRLAKIVIGTRRDLPINSSADRRSQMGGLIYLSIENASTPSYSPFATGFILPLTLPPHYMRLPLKRRLSGSNKDPVVQYDGGHPSKHRLPDLYTAACQGAYPI